MKIVPQKVEYCDHMGSDLSIVNAARVSFHKMSTEFEEQDAKLLKYLATHNHWSPFAHTAISLRIKCPIFVARQLGKHVVGLVWNEVSRRYVDEEPEFFFPDHWRGAAANVKQGSSSVIVELDVQSAYSEEGLIETPYELMRVANQVYLEMVRQGVAAEQARMILPQNMMTEFIWTGSLAAFSRVYKLRIDPHAQKEVQDIAVMLDEVINPLFPVGWKVLNDK